MDEEEFIDLVRQNRCIWDTSSDEYKNRPMKDKAWVEISQRFENMSPLECRNKWKRLKDARVANKRRMTGKSGQANTYIRPYKYAVLMSFLDDVDEGAQESSSNLNFEDSSDGLYEITLEDHDYTPMPQTPWTGSPPPWPEIPPPPPPPGPETPTPRPGPQTSTPPPRQGILAPPPQPETPGPSSRSHSQILQQRVMADRAASRQQIINQNRSRHNTEGSSSSSRSPDVERASPTASSSASGLPARRRGASAGSGDDVTQAILQELQKTPAEDEHSHFALSIVPILRRLPAVKASELKIKILELLHEAQFQ